MQRECRDEAAGKRLEKPVQPKSSRHAVRSFRGRRTCGRQLARPDREVATPGIRRAHRPRPPVPLQPEPRARRHPSTVPTQLVGARRSTMRLKKGAVAATRQESRRADEALRACPRIGMLDPPAPPLPFQAQQLLGYFTLAGTGGQSVVRTQLHDPSRRPRFHRMKPGREASELPQGDEPPQRQQARLQAREAREPVVQSYRPVRDGAAPDVDPQTAQAIRQQEVLGSTRRSQQARQRRQAGEIEPVDPASPCLSWQHEGMNACAPHWASQRRRQVRILECVESPAGRCGVKGAGLTTSACLPGGRPIFFVSPQPFPGEARAIHPRQSRISLRVPPVRTIR